jgi:hypothetical protein
MVLVSGADLARAGAAYNASPLFFTNGGGMPLDSPTQLAGDAMAAGRSPDPLPPASMADAAHSSTEGSPGAQLTQAGSSSPPGTQTQQSPAEKVRPCLWQPGGCAAAVLQGSTHCAKPPKRPLSS